jgi:hypothetical protein
VELIAEDVGIHSNSVLRSPGTLGSVQPKRGFGPSSPSRGTIEHFSASITIFEELLDISNSDVLKILLCELVPLRVAKTFENTRLPCMKTLNIAIAAKKINTDIVVLFLRIISLIFEKVILTCIIRRY